MEKIVGRDGTEVITYEFPYMRRADKRTNWEKFRQGCYNPDEGSFLGRQPSAWGELELFSYLKNKEHTNFLSSYIIYIFYFLIFILMGTSRFYNNTKCRRTYNQWIVI